MRVALSLAKFNTNIDPTKWPITELVDRVGSQLGAVEDVIDLGAQYQGVIIARVVSCADHPDADRLHICKIDDGGVAEGVERDADGHVQVVCGAPNVAEGMLVAWLPPGATVPSTFGKEPFVLEARKLRGVLSNGMLASAKELGISDDHEGILEVEEDVAPGTAFAAAYHLDDHIIDIENKMFTHRPDCFGVLGVYREMAGIYGQQFEGPDWYSKGDQYSLEREADELPLAVSNELPELVPRFMAIAMRDVTIKPSPVWLQTHLMRAGIRPINNVVDITNYLMYLTGQPLHSYDYDKVMALGGGEAASLTVRYPREGEKVQLLNGKEITPRNQAIMIATGDHLIGVGGIMGGSETEVDDDTRNIILECATFDMYSVRRTSMTNGLFTDAVTRFNKGQSPLQNPRVIAKAVHEVQQLAGGKIAGEMMDDNHVEPEALQRMSLYPSVKVTPRFINERLGLKLGMLDMKKLLENVEFTFPQVTDADPDAPLEVTAPFWRTDIETPEDVVEEVGRLYGYDHLPLELPVRTLAPAARSLSCDVKRRIRDLLSRAGANEVLTYSFVHGDLLAKTGQDKDQAFQISNAISPDLQYYRLSLTPSLLDLVHGNIKAGYDQFALFEVNKVHSKTCMDEDGLPNEYMRLALVFAADAKTYAAEYSGSVYYQAHHYLASVLDGFGVGDKYKLVPLSDAEFSGSCGKILQQMCAAYEPKRAAVLMRGQQIVGVVGEYRAAVRKALKLPDATAGFEIWESELEEGIESKYVQLPRFPKIEQDISLKVPATLNYADVYELVRSEVDSLRPEGTLPTISPVDIYQRQDDTEHKQITLRLSIASYERTLKAEEVNELLDRVANKAKERFGAERI